MRSSADSGWSITGTDRRRRGRRAEGPRVWEIRKHGSVTGVETGSTVRCGGPLEAERQE